MLEKSDKIDLSEVEFTVVDASLVKMSVTNYGSVPAVKELLDGNAILVPHNTALSRMYRFAKTNNYNFHKKRIKDGLILWMDKK